MLHPNRPPAAAAPAVQPCRMCRLLLASVQPSQGPATQLLRLSDGRNGRNNALMPVLGCMEVRTTRRRCMSACRCGGPALYIGHLRSVRRGMRCQHSGAECAVMHVQELRRPALPPGLPREGTSTAASHSIGNTPGMLLQATHNTPALHTCMVISAVLGVCSRGNLAAAGITLPFGPTRLQYACWLTQRVPHTPCASSQHGSSHALPNLSLGDAYQRVRGHAYCVPTRVPVLRWRRSCCCRRCCRCCAPTTRSTSRASGWSAIARRGSSAPAAAARAHSTQGPALARSTSHTPYTHATRSRRRRKRCVGGGRWGPEGHTAGACLVSLDTHTKPPQG